jgi:hypothetical protein
LDDFDLYFGLPESYLTDLNAMLLLCMRESKNRGPQEVPTVLSQHLPPFKSAGNSQEMVYADVISELPELSFPIIVIPYVRYRSWCTSAYRGRMHTTKYLKNILLVYHHKALDVCGHVWRQECGGVMERPIGQFSRLSIVRGPPPDPTRPSEPYGQMFIEEVRKMADAIIQARDFFRPPPPRGGAPYSIDNVMQR